jgi:hypothetical protein
VNPRSTTGDSLATPTIGITPWSTDHGGVEVALAP